MNLLQTAIQKLVCLGVAVCGVLLIWAWYDTPDIFLEDLLAEVDGWRHTVIRLIDTPKGWRASLFFLGGGGLLMIVGLLGLLPIRRFGTRGKVISFEGAHGNVVIQLDSVETTLNRVVGKMTEVKKITVNVVPADDNRRVRVVADVLLYKDLKVGARETANRISQYIADTAVNILGVEEVTAVDLNVRGIIVDHIAPALPLEQEAPLPEPEPAREELPVGEDEAEEPPMPGRLLPEEEPLAAQAERGLPEELEAGRAPTPIEEAEPEGEDAELFLVEEEPEHRRQEEEDEPPPLL